MQLDGTSKRKRRSSESSDGDVENSNVPEAKRLREDDKTSPSEDVDLATEERLPLSEIAVGQPYESSETGDSDWLEVCTEELIERDQELDNCGGDTIDNDSDTCSPSHLQKYSDRKIEIEEPAIASFHGPEPSTSGLDVLERNCYNNRKFFYTKTELINFFKRRERTATEERSDCLFETNPGLQPKMRSVLLEWIVEVCDVYKLHRETYHLAVDYLDRYLCQSKNISKSQLQLIGVTALLIAAKYEEIYPPKISDFAYITDGACTDQDIIRMESLMVQVLKWRFTVITSNAWVLGFLQLLCVYETKDCAEPDISVPLYKHSIYETITHLLDLCSLDWSYIKFPYKVLALSSILIVISQPNPIILSVSGYTYHDLSDCMTWMRPFWNALCQKCSYDRISEASKIFDTSTRASDFSHLRIKHNIDLDILEAVYNMTETVQADEIPELLTPPSSSEKRKGRSKSCTTELSHTPA